MNSVNTSELVNNYSSKFLDALPDGHGVSSPLGVWILLSLLAPSLEGEEREKLETILGASAEQVNMEATRLLNTLPEDVTSGVAFWFRENYLNMLNVENFLKTLPAVVEVGDSISQNHADSWVDQKTLGIIDRFPVKITDETAFVLASTLATKIDWKYPFKETAPIVTGEFAEHALEGMVAHDLHYKAIFKTSYGYAGVHMAENFEKRTTSHILNGGIKETTRGEKGVLETYSIIMGNPETSQKDAQKAALEIISGKAVKLSLFDLPLGDATSWGVSEHVVYSEKNTGREEKIDALVAAWSAEGEHDLLKNVGIPGVTVAVKHITSWVKPPAEINATQSAKAEYNGTGFTATAVTVFDGIATSGMPKPPQHRVTVRTANIKFDSPYTVVATVKTSERETIPAFIAWVQTPSNP